jgi:signal recognition particle subunit SRP54
MLENLTDRMSKALRNVRGVGRLTEENISESLKEIRSALLGADVHFKVVRQFIESVQEKCLGEEVIKSVTPGQLIVKIINDELIQLLGGDSQSLKEKRPLKIMMVGLHGAGKTTTSAKIAKFLCKENYKKPLLVGCDVYRPAAIDQLETLAKQENFLFHSDRNTKEVSKIAKEALAKGNENQADLLVFDTAGRLQIDEDLIQEIVALKDQIRPDEILLVADAALGQEAVNVAKHFNEAVPLSGIVLTKVDGDARGGAALSMRYVTQVPIQFMGTGEKIEDFSAFHPDRIASRILGMGDIVSLVEKAQENIDEEESARMAEKLKKADFNFEDFLNQFQQIKKMGSLSSIMSMLPGTGNLNVGDKEEGQFKKMEAIIQSMTKEERIKPNIISGSRRLRIASGSGTQVKDVNQLIKQFTMMRKMMKKFKGNKGRKKMEKFAGKMGGMGGLPGF